MNMRILGLCAVVVGVCAVGWGDEPSTEPSSLPKEGRKLAQGLEKAWPEDLTPLGLKGKQKKLLFVNSYHAGFTWSDDIERGLLKVFHITVNADGSYNTSNSVAVIKVIRMDTKLNKAESFKRKAALNVKQVIDTWQPDVVVMSDDNAVKYVLVPYFKNSEYPFVFCGVNWDASMYGLPVKNVTGMLEVAFIHETIDLLKQYAAGDRVGYIGVDTLSHGKDLDFFVNQLGIDIKRGVLVKDFEEWKREYLKLQDSVDMVILNVIGIPGWDKAAAQEFILEHTRVPSATITDASADYAMISVVQIAEEQGWWAGNAALKILQGMAPSDIPVAHNTGSRIYINMRIANVLGVKFPVELLEQATLIE